MNRLQKLFSILLLLALPFFQIQAETLNIYTSEYTDLKTECKNMEMEDSGGSDIPLVCKGYGGFSVEISYSVYGIFLNIRKGDKSISLNSSDTFFDTSKRKLEWRMKNGNPIALILRVKKYRSGDTSENPFIKKNEIGEFLIVKGIEFPERQYAEINTKKKGHNTKAQSIADSFSP